MALIGGPLYQSPPGSGANDGALPKVYDPDWQLFVNLTPDQIRAFQNFPPDLQKYTLAQVWILQAGGATVQVTFTDPTQPIIPGVVASFLARVGNASSGLLTNINAQPPTVVNRTQVDAVVRSNNG